MTADEKGFLAAIKKEPKDVAARSAYADWLDEHERPYEAAVQRGKAGLSEVFYKVRRKSDGLFSTGRVDYGTAMVWSAGGKMWRRLTDLHAHFRGQSRPNSYGGTAWNNVEVVVVEVRTTYTAALQIKRERPKGKASVQTIVVEPLGAPTETK